MDSIIVNNETQNPVIIPTDLPENTVIRYSCQKRRTTYNLLVRRLNYTDVYFKIFGFSNKKLILKHCDTAHLSPSFYNASDGTYEDENGNLFGLNNFHFESNRTSGQLLIPNGSIKFIGFSLNNAESFGFTLQKE